MRFVADGPNIPNGLIAARDEGRVVFLCGAGVSVPAGLPDFFTLAAHVARDLGVETNDELGKMLTQAKPAPGQYGPGIDEVFSGFYEAYGATQVKEAVFKRLRRNRGRKTLAHHRDLLALATGPDGRVRLVTTNFDRLFERAGRRLRLYTPPRLPDLAGSEAFDGVVHLHGAIQEAEAGWWEMPPIVLSRAEFGAAYLADGWATAFMKGLLRTNIVVMVGYSANDPPVRYLLEGLQQGEDRLCQEIYAFASGTDEATQAAWRGRGVTAIRYDAANQHGALWDTITAWAGQASDPERWRQGVVALAQRGPAALAPFERGQVVALCSTAAGAREFQEAEPRAPAEWLCVFDAACRCGPGPEQARRIMCFGLDDEPPYDSERVNQPGGVIDLLQELPGEPMLRRPASLAPETFDRGGDFSTRLWRISTWIAQVADSPTAVWWAAQQRHLNRRLDSGLVRQIKNRVNKTDFGKPLLRQAWRFLLEALDFSEEFLIHEATWARATKQDEGWSAHALLMFERYIRPRVALVKVRGPDCPPEGEPNSLRDFAKFKVFYPDIQFGGDIAAWATDVIEALVGVIEGGILVGRMLERQIFGYDFPGPERDKYGSVLNSLREVLAERVGMPVVSAETEPTVALIEFAEPSACRQINETTGPVYNSPISHSHAKNVRSSLYERWSDQVKDPTSSLSSADLRTELKAATDAVRFDTIQTFRDHMCQLIKDGGAAGEVFRRFIQEAWPREQRYQTAATTEQIIIVLSQLGDDFACCTKLAKHCLVPMPWLFQVFHYLGLEVVYRFEATDGSLPCYKRDPWATFIILDSIFDRTNLFQVPTLGEALRKLSEQERGLLRDRRYQRLVAFVRQHGGG